MVALQQVFPPMEGFEEQLQALLSLQPQPWQLLALGLVEPQPWQLLALGLVYPQPRQLLALELVELALGLV